MTGVASGSDAARAIAGGAVTSVAPVACFAQSCSSLVAVVAGNADGSLRAGVSDDGDSGLLHPQTIAQAQTMIRATTAWRLETVGIGVLRLRWCGSTQRCAA
ncbi:hypothetical protein A9R05_24120 [Burkholderia sp. KK1]|nr:hypothetical protein A9R05_24120 [Burkholderia sp. KK1]